MGRYSQDFKDRAVARLLPPESASITTVSQEQGVSVATLERWRADALSRPAERGCMPVSASSVEGELLVAPQPQAGVNATGESTPYFALEEPRVGARWLRAKPVPPR